MGSDEIGAIAGMGMEVGKPPVGPRIPLTRAASEAEDDRVRLSTLTALLSASEESADRVGAAGSLASHPDGDNEGSGGPGQSGTAMSEGGTEQEDGGVPPIVPAGVGLATVCALAGRELSRFLPL